MRRTRGIQYALLGVVAQHPEGLHGYALKRECERMLGSSWQLGFAEIYRVLDRLAGARLLEHVVSTPGSLRKVYRITPAGRRSLDEFVVAPPDDVPRPLRHELAVKLLFAGPERYPELLRVIEQQLASCVRELHLLGVQRRKIRRPPVDPFATGLVIDGAERAVGAEIAWLEAVAAKLKARSGGFVAPAAPTAQRA